jgi:hypothetical protein
LGASMVFSPILLGLQCLGDISMSLIVRRLHR